jgi:peptidoglycan/LPS O-acetylase OafA/YrhL
LKFIAAWFWESSQNIPLILGFLLATRLRAENTLLALACFIAGVTIGSVILHFTEQKLKPDEKKSTLKETLTAFLLYALLGVPLLFYFTSQSEWVNWKSDVAIGVVVGLLLTIVQSVMKKDNKLLVFVNGVAMALAVALVMVAFRLVMQIESQTILLLLGLFIALLSSAAIVLINYRKKVFSD